jgi:hypothetical protein
MLPYSIFFLKLVPCEVLFREYAAGALKRKTRYPAFSVYRKLLALIDGSCTAPVFRGA